MIFAKGHGTQNDFVLLPDPALSTGYGRDFVARGHREWATRPMAEIVR